MIPNKTLQTSSRVRIVYTSSNAVDPRLSETPSSDVRRRELMRILLAVMAKADVERQLGDRAERRRKLCKDVANKSSNESGST